MKTFPGHRKYQQGVALMLIFLMVFSVGATVFLSSVNTNQIEVRQINDLRIEMVKAKQALIAYARNYHQYGFDNDGDSFTDDEGPGRLICPDVDKDGEADSNSTDCTDYVRGRLPERFTYSSGGTDVHVTLNNYFSSLDQQFWYVVSPAFKEITSGNVNNYTTGDLLIDGVPDYVAVIIAPGEALSGQNRALDNTDPSNYLELVNLSGTTFINPDPATLDELNDQVIGITAAELRVEIVAQIHEETKNALVDYYAANTFLPTLAALSTFMESNGYRWIVEEGYTAAYTGYLVHNIHGGTQHWYDPYVYFARQECDEGATSFFYVPNSLPNDLWPAGVTC